MKFKKEVILDIMESEDDVIYTKIIDKSRWCDIYEWVFRFENKFYMSNYRVGSSELQEERPYEFDREIECKEVFPVQKTITVYE